MVDILPFRGLIYNREKIRDISKVVSPPYDVITKKRREEILSCSRNNIVNLILPEGDEDRRYGNASRILKDWLDKKILIQDNRKCFYVLEIGFKIKGVLRRMTAFIGLTRIEPYSSGKVLRHEKTLSGPKEDRYRLLESCRTNFGLIYTIYKGHGEINKILRSYSGNHPFISIKPCYNDNLSFSMWKIPKKEDIDVITDIMRDRSLLIADGHHRYETSLMYKNNNQMHSHAPHSRDYVLTLFMDSSQRELKIYPTHRVLSFNNPVNADRYFSLIKNKYNIESLLIENGSDAEAVLEDFRRKGIKGFILYFKQEAYSLTLKSTHPDYNTDKPDVFILHNDILKDLGDIFGTRDISFNHSGDHIIRDVDTGTYDLGVFLNPPAIQDVERICYSGGLMPQKSTYFWPKPCTGLVMYRF